MQDFISTRYLDIVSKHKRKIIDVIAREGLTGLIKKAITIVSNYVFKYNKLVIYELDLRKPLKPVRAKMDLVFRIAQISDIEAMDKGSYNCSDKDKIYLFKRLEEGDKCILALHKERIVGYVWVMKDFMELSQSHFIHLPKNKTYIYKSWVLSEYRGQRVLNAIDNHIFAILKREKEEAVVTTVNITNTAAVKPRERIGFKRIGHILQFSSFGFMYNHISKKDLAVLLD